MKMYPHKFCNSVTYEWNYIGIKLFHFCEGPPGTTSNTQRGPTLVFIQCWFNSRSAAGCNKKQRFTKGFWCLSTCCRRLILPLVSLFFYTCPVCVLWFYSGIKMDNGRTSPLLLCKALLVSSRKHCVNPYCCLLAHSVSVHVVMIGTQWIRYKTQKTDRETVQRFYEELTQRAFNVVIFKYASYNHPFLSACG